MLKPTFTAPCGGLHFDPVNFPQECNTAVCNDFENCGVWFTFQKTGNVLTIQQIINASTRQPAPAKEEEVLPTEAEFTQEGIEGIPEEERTQQLEALRATIQQPQPTMITGISSTYEGVTDTQTISQVLQEISKLIMILGDLLYPPPGVLHPRAAMDISQVMDAPIIKVTKQLKKVLTPITAPLAVIKVAPAASVGDKFVQFETFLSQYKGQPASVFTELRTQRKFPTMLSPFFTVRKIAKEEFKFTPKEMDKLNKEYFEQQGINLK
uniref:Uncharacterized protein n=1 Tax=viral metagenome TaxID=1070528 RepID=A0A6M3L393_9ZZZZ